MNFWFSDGQGYFNELTKQKLSIFQTNRANEFFSGIFIQEQTAADLIFHINFFLYIKSTEACKQTHVISVIFKRQS